MNKLFHFLAMLLVLLLSGCASAQVSLGKACLRHAAPKCPNYPDWQKSRGVLYMAEHGRIFKMTLESKRADLLADHGFEYISTFKLSPSGHHIAYDGFTAGAGFAAYIYDLRSNTDFKMPGDGKLEFSPNSKLVVQTNMHNPANAKQLKLVDLDTHPFNVITIPSPIDVASLGDYRNSESKWSLDSRRLYLGMLAYLDPGQRLNCRYFVYDVQEGTFKKIDGRCVVSAADATADEGFHFIENQREVTVFEP